MTNTKVFASAEVAAVAAAAFVGMVCGNMPGSETERSLAKAFYDELQVDGRLVVRNMEFVVLSMAEPIAA